MSWDSSSSRRVTNFSDLIQRVTASCLLHPLGSQSHSVSCHDDTSEEEEEGEEVAQQASNESESKTNSESPSDNEHSELEMLMWQVFDVVADMKRAYSSLQAAHSPWYPDRMRAADAAVVAEFRRVGVLRERFRRRGRNNGSGGGSGGGYVREVVRPYEAAVEELERKLKIKQAEIDNLKAKQENTVKGSKSRSGRESKKKLILNCSAVIHSSPAPELFEATMSSVIKASKSFTGDLLSLMRSAKWDMAAVTKSIHSSTTADPNAALLVGPHHAKYAIESYVSHKMFQNFDHETFYMDGSLSSLLDPDQFRLNCFAQYRDMQAMDPAELLGILPTCPFGKFCSKKYLEILHEKMEDSLFGGDLEQRRLVAAGTHPRTHFYGQFLALAKAVWLLHLLAFSLDPPPSRFEAAQGAEFNPQFMENVESSNISHQLVGFPLTPGFKLGNGSVIKARVCLVPKAS